MSQYNFQRVSCYMSYMWQNSEKYVYIELWYGQILLTGKHNTRNAEIKQNELLQMQELPPTTQTKCTCVCCNTDVHKDVCKMYNKVDLDFSSFVVSQCLGHVSNSANDEDQYICPSCDKRLKETTNENPVLPYYGKYPNPVTGANFLNTLNQRPEYVCTCCHHMLFCKTLQMFHTTHYDMSDETVK